MRTSTTAVSQTVESAKAKELATDEGLIERLKMALDEVRQGKTISLAQLPQAIARRRSKSQARAAQA